MVGLCVAATLAVLAGVFLVYPDGDGNAARSHKQRLLDAAMDRIRVVGARKPFQPATSGPRLAGASQADRPGMFSVPEPPDDFTFASFNGEMTKDST